MSGDIQHSRRALIANVGRTAALGIISGCVGNKGGGGSETKTDVCGVDPPSEACVDKRIAEQLSDVDNFDRVRDWTGRAEVTIKVGVNNGGQPYGFGPPAVRVNPETTIIWEWTGEGGPHNVIAETDHKINSQLTNRPGYTYEYVYDGTMSKVQIDYYCSTHEQEGMRGVIAVDRQSRV